MRVKEFPDLPLGFEVFGVANPRARHNDAEFQDLKGCTLSVAQKDFFARQCRGLFAEGEPDIRFGNSNRQLAARYGLSQGVTCLWVANYASDHAVNHAGRGRPDSVDEKGLQDFLATVSKGKQVAGGTSKAKK